MNSAIEDVKIQQSLMHDNVIEIVDYSYDSDSGNFYTLFEKAEIDMEKIFRNLNNLQMPYYDRVKESANL